MVFLLSIFRCRRRCRGGAIQRRGSARGGPLLSGWPAAIVQGQSRRSSSFPGRGAMAGGGRWVPRAAPPPPGRGRPPRRSRAHSARVWHKAPPRRRREHERPVPRRVQAAVCSSSSRASQQNEFAAADFHSLSRWYSRQLAGCCARRTADRMGMPRRRWSCSAAADGKASKDAGGHIVHTPLPKVPSRSSARTAPRCLAGQHLAVSVQNPG